MYCETMEKYASNINQGAYNQRLPISKYRNELIYFTKKKRSQASCIWKFKIIPDSEVHLFCSMLTNNKSKK